MFSLRLCARPGCSARATATLGFQYANSTAWLDDLADPEPSTIDLCTRHADRLVPPVGWVGHDRRSAISASDPTTTDDRDQDAHYQAGGELPGGDPTRSDDVVRSDASRCLTA